ncbi:MAG: hypothetical protein ABL901_10310 [Hyphomicrobiaceae bacterium]
MQITTIDITQMTSAVRRHEALLRYARYMLVFNLGIFIWIAVTQLPRAGSREALIGLITGPSWQWAGIVLGSVGATYLILAHRLWWAYAAIFAAQVAYFIAPSPDKQIFWASLTIPYSVLTQPAMRPLAPLATELAIMTLGFSYVMIVFCLYSAAWSLMAPKVPRAAYGPSPSWLQPLYPSHLLETLLPGHKSQSVSLWESAVFALASAFFIAASMGFFFGIRSIQNGFVTFAVDVTAACLQSGQSQTAEDRIACLAQPYSWSRAAFDLGVPIAIAAICLIAANQLRHHGKQHFVRRLAERQVTPAGATLFLRAFRDDQVAIRRASRNLFSFVFDLGRTPGTLDELMLERLDGRGDLIAIGNPQDAKGTARQSPWGAQRLYVGDAIWQDTVAKLVAEAERIVLCVDASDGVRWEIAHVLGGNHALKALFFFNPALDAATRKRLLTEDFGIAPARLAALDVDQILALKLSSPDHLTVVLCAKPEREAHLVAARLAFAAADHPGA